MEFQNGKIYKLVCSETGNIYYGSTIKTLKHRLKKHKAKNNTCSSKSFINPTIHLIKNYPCNSKQELRDEEAKYIKDLECVNINIPGRTRKEYYKDNENKLKQWRLDNAEKLKQYRFDNAEKQKEFNKQYRLDNLEKIKEQKKQWYLNNIEKQKETNKQYRLDNNNKLNKKFNCECGGKYTHRSKTIHLKTKKHLNYINSNIN